MLYDLSNHKKATSTPLKVGLFGIGLETYWPQFKGLKERLEGYLSEVHQKLSRIHPNIINAGLVDSVDKAFEAGRKFKAEDCVWQNWSGCAPFMCFAFLLLPRSTNKMC